MPPNKYLQDVPDTVRRYVEGQQGLASHYNDILVRLVESDQMIDAWRSIEPTKAKAFIISAISAYHDYKVTREETKVVEELLAAIGSTASDLSAKFSRLYNIQNYSLPWEFRRIEELLRSSDSTRERKKLLQWNKLKNKVLGERYKAVDFSKDSVETHIEYPWEFAPTLPDLLNTITKIAKNHRPYPNTTHTQAALEKKSNQPLTDYIRGLSVYLQMNGFEQNATTSKIIAATINSVYELDGNYDADSVSKALAKYPATKMKKKK